MQDIYNVTLKDYFKNIKKNNIPIYFMSENRNE